MGNFFELVKINVTVALCQMNIIQISGRKKKSRAFLWGLGAGVIFLMVYMGIYGGAMTNALAPYGLSWVVLWASQFLFAAMSLMTGIYTVNGLLFESRDLEPLFAYPLRQWQILLSKICALVIEDWIFGAVFILPVIGVYGVLTRQEVPFYAVALLGFLAAPLLPLGLAILFSFLTNALTAGKRFRNLLNIILTIAVFLGVTAAIQSAVPAPDALPPDPAALMAQLDGYYLPASLYVKGCGGNLLGFSAFLAVSILPFLAVVWVLSFFYRNLCSRTSVTKKAKTKDYRAKTSGKYSAFLQKEFGRFFSSAIYVLNTSVGMILLTMFAISSFFTVEDMQELMTSLGSDRSVIFLLAFGFMAAMTSTTAPSISLEGGSLWIAQTSPVPPQTILRAKMGVQLWVTLPLIAINSALVSVAVRLTFFEFLWLTVLPMLIAAASGYLGLIANLHYPRFDYSNITQAVKNSAGVLITLFGMWSALAILAGIYFLARNLLPFQGAAAVCAVILSALVFLMRRYVYTKGAALWQQLS